MSNLLISRVSSLGSMSDAFFDNSSELTNMSTPKSTTKKFSHLFDALSYSSLSDKLDKINEQQMSNVCNMCREKSTTKKYINKLEDKNNTKNIYLNLCYFCENEDEIKNNWIVCDE